MTAGWIPRVHGPPDRCATVRSTVGAAGRPLFSRVRSRLRSPSKKASVGGSAWLSGGILAPVQSTSTPEKAVKNLLSMIDPIKIVLAVLIAIAAFWVWSVVRTAVAEPLDRFVTEQLCEDHGEEISRELLGFERSNRFGLRNRSEGFCFYGEGPQGEAPITLTIEDTLPGPRYRAAKWIGIIIQLGLVSIFVRFVVDPVMDTYRYIRQRFIKQS